MTSRKGNFFGKRQCPSSDSENEITEEKNDQDVLPDSSKKVASRERKPSPSSSTEVSSKNPKCSRKSIDEGTTDDSQKLNIQVHQSYKDHVPADLPNDGRPDEADSENEPLSQHSEASDRSARDFQAHSASQVSSIQNRGDTFPIPEPDDVRPGPSGTQALTDAAEGRKHFSAMLKQGQFHRNEMNCRISKLEFNTRRRVLEEEKNKLEHLAAKLKKEKEIAKQQERETDELRKKAAEAFKKAREELAKAKKDEEAARAIREVRRRRLADMIDAEQKEERGRDEENEGSSRPCDKDAFNNDN